MLAALTSGAHQVAGTLLALANPRTVERSSSADPSQRSQPVPAIGQAQGPVGKYELTEEERQEVEELRNGDREIRQHEQAHRAAAGQYAKGPPSFEYEVGPDGRQYAVEGEVSIDTSEVPGDPRATVEKMRVIQWAANAPAEPSAKDRQIAAEAAKTEREARAELAKQRRAATPDRTDNAARQPTPPTDPTTPDRPDRAFAQAAGTRLAHVLAGFDKLDSAGRFIDVRV